MGDAKSTQQLLDSLPSSITYVEKGHRKDYNLELILKITKTEVNMYSAYYEYPYDSCPCGCGDYYDRMMLIVDSGNFQECLIELNAKVKEYQKEFTQ